MNAVYAHSRPVPVFDGARRLSNQRGDRDDQEGTDADRGADWGGGADQSVRNSQRNTGVCRRASDGSCGCLCQQWGCRRAGFSIGAHVLTEDLQLSKVIRQGLSQSPTFRELMNRIDRLSGLVVVSIVPVNKEEP
jgi:hypothetical protein